jgi:hypothetical protein
MQALFFFENRMPVGPLMLLTLEMMINFFSTEESNPASS